MLFRSSLAENPKFHQRTKHINMKYYFIQEYITKGTINLYYIPSIEMTANRLTKPLIVAKHSEFIALLRIKVINIRLSSKGYIEGLI